jgi:outer membrane lipoprotein-sorting protein
MSSGKAATCVLAVLALVIAAAGACSSRSSRHADEDAPNSSAPVSSASATPEASPAPVTWGDVARNYEHVNDYVCTYEKEERAISKGERQTIRLYFRKPFDVRMEWLDDHGAVDQTGVYRQGANDGKVLARQHGGLGSLMGTLRLDPNESLALSDSRHPVTEVGIGKIIERAAQAAADSRIVSRYAGEDALDGRPAYKFEFVAGAGTSVGGLDGAHKALVWVDRELKLPVRLELYDAANVLLERHRFKDVRVNTKLADKTFTL